MLVCFHNQSKLPQDDLVYLACLFSLNETIAEIEIFSELDDDDDLPSGFLAMVPFLHAAPLPVQIELLGETWSNHRSASQIQATLLDAAIVYAAFMTAVRIVNDDPELATTWLADNHRKLHPRLIHRGTEQPDAPTDLSTDDKDIIQKVKQSLKEEVGNGIRIEHRERGWVVVDQTNCYLADIDYPCRFSGMTMRKCRHCTLIVPRMHTGRTSNHKSQCSC